MIRRAARSTSWHERTDRRRRHARLLRLAEDGVGLGDVRRYVAGEHAASRVAAVAVHRAAEVAQHDLAVGDHPVAGVVVRAGCVLAGGDDGEVHLVVPLGDEAGRDVGRHLGLGAADERDLTAVELVGDAIGGRTGGPQRSDLGRVLDHSQRADDVDRPAERRLGQARQQLHEESGPHLVADGRRRGAADELGDDGRRVVGLLPRAQTERARLLDHARCLEPRDDHRGIAVAWHDEHGQPLQRHRLVAGEVGQVVADRQQQDVHALVGHGLADPVEPLEVDRRSHPPSLPPGSRADPSPSAGRVRAVGSGPHGDLDRLRRTGRRTRPPTWRGSSTGSAGWPRRGRGRAAARRAPTRRSGPARPSARRGGGATSGGGTGRSSRCRRRCRRGRPGNRRPRRRSRPCRR